MSAAEELGGILRDGKLTLAAAESCTGGLVGDLITNVPGSSDYFLGSAVTYSNEAKIKILGVKLETLKSHGAVSEHVAKEMAAGCLKAFKSSVGVSTTGIAGPTGGSNEKPVGLVWFAVTDGKRTKTDKVVFPGDRMSVKKAAANHALHMVIEFVSGA